MEKEIRAIIRNVSLIRQQANEFMRKELDQRGFTDVDTAHSQIFEILLTANGPVAMKTFVEKTGRAKSTITGVIDTLEARGFVERAVMPEDRRQVGVVPTAKAKNLQARFSEMSASLLDTVYKGFTREERQQLHRYLMRIQENLSSS